MTPVSVQNRPLQLSLSRAQLDIWLSEKLNPGRTHFHIYTTHELKLPLDEARFLAAVDWVFAHYEALYGQLIETDTGDPLLVFDPSKALCCSFVDLSQKEDPSAAYEVFAAEQARLPFALTAAPLHRSTLVKLGAGNYVFTSHHHHLLLDGWGTGVLFSRILEAYETLGKGEEPKPQGRSYISFLREQQALAESPATERQLAFWRGLYGSPVGTLPGVLSHRLTGEARATTCHRLPLSRTLADKLALQAKEANASLFHVLLLVYAWVLKRHFGLESFWLPLPILNRGGDYKDTLGFFVESRLVPVCIDEALSFRDNLTALARQIREVFRHYRIPQGELERLQTEAGLGSLPRELCSFSYLTRDFSASLEGVPLPMTTGLPAYQGCALAAYVIDGHPGHDLSLELTSLPYLVQPEEAVWILRRFRHFLGVFCEHPGSVFAELGCCPEDELLAITEYLRPTEEIASPSFPVIHDIVERAKQWPHQVAVIEGERQITYEECLAHASGVASRLQRQGHRPGEAVAVLLPRGCALVASYLGIMFAGGTIVPMDTMMPPLRLRQMVEDTGARLLITVPALLSLAQGVGVEILDITDIPRRQEHPLPLATFDQTAFIIFTSGSTGRPKGVRIGHLGLAQHLMSMQRRLPLPSEGRCLLFYSPAFDASLDVIFPSLFRGLTLVAAPHPQWSVFELPRELVRLRIRSALLPPSYLLEVLRLLRQSSAALKGHCLELVLAGGETMHAELGELWDEVMGDAVPLYNVYGPTECIVTATVFRKPPSYRCGPGESVPIGLPYAGRRLRIVDDKGHDQPFGAEGELLIGGIGLAEGYVNRPSETASRFITTSDGQRYYRSGDMVRLKPDGRLLFCGRRDAQIKLNGFRIELGEIETCIQSYPAVTGVAVLARPRNEGGELELLAHVAFSPASRDAESGLLSHLKQRLPGYMLPRLIVHSVLPRTVSGKPDRTALLRHASPELTPPVCSALEEDPVLRFLGLLWRQVLGEGCPVTPEADFFELGGKSLLAAKLVSAVNRAFRVDFPFADFLQRPTLAEMARILPSLVGGPRRAKEIACLRLELADMSAEQLRHSLSLATSSSAIEKTKA